MLYIMFESLLKFGLVVISCVRLLIIVVIINSKMRKLVFSLCLICLFNIYYYNRLNIKCIMLKWMSVGFNKCYYWLLLSNWFSGWIISCLVMGWNKLINDSRKISV